MTTEEFLIGADKLSVKKLCRDTMCINEKGGNNTKANLQESIGFNCEESIDKFDSFFKNLDFLLEETLSLKGTFKDKYKNLPNKSEVNKIFKNIYRISKLIRNAERHNEKSISYNGSILEIEYSYCATDFFLKIDKDAFCFLEEIIYEFVFLYDNGYSEKYQELLLGNFYELVKKHFYLSEFKDDISEPFFDVKPCPKVNTVRRSSCRGLEYSVLETRLVFNVPSNVIPNSVNVEKYFGVDIWVNIQGKDYIFPSEILDKDYSISLDEIEKFVMEKYAGWL